MVEQGCRNRIRKIFLFCSMALCAFMLCSPRAGAQVLAAISGTVTDASGGAISGAKAAATDVETGELRSTVTDNVGRYQFEALPEGEYEVTVTKDGFQTAVRRGIHLVISQQAAVDVALQVGNVSQRMVVNGDAPIVNTTTKDISGVVNERQIKDLPLNGRSYDRLMLLDPSVVDFTFEKTGGIGISNSTTANMFSVEGNRPQQNLFLLNGVEYTGAAENNMTPGGASGQLLGIDGVREFNLLRDGYGAEYGKKPGGQVSIVTQSGSNQWHGTAFEFVRNSALDARNFFDPSGAAPPPFKRNQFGASVGGPVHKDQTFFFANYEGFRQDWGLTSLALVPDMNSRNDANQNVKNLGLLNLWPAPPPGATDITVCTTAQGCPGTDGVAEIFGNSPQHIREDFGTARLDHIFSATDSIAAIYTADDSASNTATPADPYATDILTLREQVASVEQTHTFSPSLLNTARFGYSRAGYFFTGEPTPGTPAAAVQPFLTGAPFVGAVVVGGSQASNPQAQIGLAGSNNGSNLHIARSLFTINDDVSLTRGRNEFRFGVWFQPFLSNENIALSQYGQMTFSGLPALLNGTASFLYDPASTPMAWRSLFGAWYAEDVIRVRPSLAVSLGFRDEFSNGLNEANGHAANYTYDSNGKILCASQPAANVCLPSVGKSLFTVNRAKFLPQPRIGLAWSPFGSKAAIRASFGMFNDLQDALGYRLDQNAPFNPVFNVPATAGNVSTLFPINPAANPPANALLVPGGVQPDMYTPTVISYSLSVERELTPNTSISVRYVGNHGYHELVGADANAPQPVVCPAAPCPVDFPNSAGYGVLAEKPVPAGTLFTPGSPAAVAKPNTALAQTWTWSSEGTSDYNAMEISFNRRFSQGLTLRGTYTLAKALDDGDSLNATAANNAPGLISDPYDVHVDWGPATYDVRNSASVNTTYALPIGHNQPLLGNANGKLNAVVSGWSLNSIILVQSGFPFTPQLSYNPANSGDTRNPVRPFLDPTFTGKVVTGNPNQWFNSNAFIAFPSNSGFSGNVGRDAYTGPGLATLDFSVFKDIGLREGVKLEFRGEFFNLLNRANFNTPNLISYILQPSPNQTLSEPSPTSGQITATSTTSRQIQFGLKLTW